MLVDWSDRFKINSLITRKKIECFALIQIRDLHGHVCAAWHVWMNYLLMIENIGWLFSFRFFCSMFVVLLFSFEITDTRSRVECRKRLLFFCVILFPFLCYCVNILLMLSSTVLLLVSFCTTMLCFFVVVLLIIWILMKRDGDLWFSI